MDMSKYDSQKATVDDQFAQMKTASEELNTEAESAASLEKLLETPAEVDEIIGEGGKVDSETKESQVENEASQVASTENATDTGGMIETTTPEEKEKAAIQTMKSDPTVQKKNEGGKISTSKGNIKDSVPVLLSPGEFVINQKIAKTIGYEKLKQINTITTNSSAQISPKTPNDISMLNNGKKKGKTTIIMQTQVVEKVTPVPV
jgi:hypothetical protein